MTEESEPDPELAAIRAKRLQELLAQQSPLEAAPRPARKVPTDLTAGSFNAFLATHSRAIVDVWAPWCGPCRTMGPILDGLAREFAGQVEFGKLNADNEGGLAGQLRVEAIPTLLLFDRGRLVDRVIGAVPGNLLRERIRAVYGLGPTAGP
jgi:thioredoxin 1